jgi:hypothetical protein
MGPACVFVAAREIKRQAGFRADEVGIQERSLESTYRRRWHPKQESEPRTVGATGWKGLVCGLVHTDIGNCQ